MTVHKCFFFLFLIFLPWQYILLILSVSPEIVLQVLSCCCCCCCGRVLFLNYACICVFHPICWSFSFFFLFVLLFCLSFIANVSFVGWIYVCFKNFNCIFIISFNKSLFSGWTWSPMLAEWLARALAIANKIVYVCISFWSIVL